MGTQQQLNFQLFFTEARLESLMATLDELHTAASDGRLHAMTALTQAELAGWLRELVYTAQETISEMEMNHVEPPELRLVK